MLNLIKKDLLLIFSIKSNVITLVLFFPLMMLILGSENTTGVYSLMLISYGFVLSSIPFKYELRDKPHMLIQSLPIKKKDIVISRYLAMFIYFLIGLVYTWICFYIFKLLGFEYDGKFDILTIKQSLLVLLFSSSISFPAQFRLPPKLSNIANIIIFILIINITSAISDEIGSMLLSNYFQGPLVLLLVGIIYLLSMLISIGLYETRDLY
ncbi:ABC-2 transporter permease [Tissierella sp.]|uniref:ABC-2 transporter permease n=1 Tax=Tissierella sp. TaxID=41274 RepID=UPI0028605D19|nr:ABC-2 transporter permease [Tissierella sp.]MDR7855431.1 ABC-2 transporter permease [Tissierella sp.]